MVGSRSILMKEILSFFTGTNWVPVKIESTQGVGSLLSHDLT